MSPYANYLESLRMVNSKWSMVPLTRTMMVQRAAGYDISSCDPIIRGSAAIIPTPSDIYQICFLSGK